MVRSRELHGFQNGWSNLMPAVYLWSFGVDNNGFLHLNGSITDSSLFTISDRVLLFGDYPSKNLLLPYTKQPSSSSTAVFLYVLPSSCSLSSFSRDKSFRTFATSFLSSLGGGKVISTKAESRLKTDFEGAIVEHKRWMMLKDAVSNIYFKTGGTIA